MTTLTIHGAVRTDQVETRGCVVKSTGRCAGGERQQEERQKHPQNPHYRTRANATHISLGPLFGKQGRQCRAYPLCKPNFPFADESYFGCREKQRKERRFEATVGIGIAKLALRHTFPATCSRSTRPMTNSKPPEVCLECSETL